MNPYILTILVSYQLPAFESLDCNDEDVSLQSKLSTTIEKFIFNLTIYNLA